MKQFKLIIILIIMIMLCMSAAVFADGEYIEIRTPEDLMAIQDDSFANYRLCNDIDLDAYAWEPFEFNGVLDGSGYSILNVHIKDAGSERRAVYDCNHKEYEACFAGLFSVLDGAEVRNLKLYNIDIELDLDYQSAFTGLLAGFVTDSMIDTVTIYGKSLLSTSGHCFGTGGVAGYGGESLIQNCEIDVMLTCIDEDATYKDEQFMGGAYALGYIDLVGNTVSIKGYDADHGYVHDGGLVGSYYKYDGDFSHGNISENTVSGFITFFEDNTNRRAYCSAYIGEVMQWTLNMDYNQESFVRDEIYDYNAELGPHWDCTNHDMTDEIVAPDYSEGDNSNSYGYTVHTCNTCGYTYKDAFRLPLIKAKSARLNLDEASAKLTPDTEGYISVNFEPLNASPKEISIISDNDSLVIDDFEYKCAQGTDTSYVAHIFAVKPGESKITLLIDGESVDSCTIDISADFTYILENYWYYGAAVCAVVLLVVVIRRKK